MRDEKGNITIKSVYKWFRSDKGKKYSFFIFYLIFFIFLFIFISIPYKESPTNNDIPKEDSSLPFKTSNLETSNYEFIFETTIDDKTITYQGIKKDKQISLMIDTQEYNYNYQDGKLVFLGEEKPTFYTEFLDIYEIKRIIKSATFITETKYQVTEQIEYNYEIKSNSLDELLNNNDSYYEETTNKIIILCNENNEIEKITLDISNFSKEENIIEEQPKLYLITITYGGKDEKNSTN